MSNFNTDEFIEWIKSSLRSEIEEFEDAKEEFLERFETSVESAMEWKADNVVAKEARAVRAENLLEAIEENDYTPRQLVGHLRKWADQVDERAVKNLTGGSSTNQFANLVEQVQGEALVDDGGMHSGGLAAKLRRLARRLEEKLDEDRDE